MATATETSGGILELSGFGVAFAQKVVLAEIDLCVADKGILALMGPCGGGKSTLLRTIAGHNDANPSLRTWGTARFLGSPLGGSEVPALVAQSAKLMMASVLENIVCNLPERWQLSQAQQRDLARRLLTAVELDDLVARLDERVVALSLAQQRHVAIIRAAAAGPRLLCLDEPTSGLGEEEAARLIAHLRREAERRALIVTIHNQQHARALGGDIALLAGGRIQERRPAEQFLAAPATEAGRDFVRVGTCLLPAPDARPEELDDGVPPPPPLPAAARSVVSSAFGPRGFLWLMRGQLAGTPQPGVVFDADYDLAALKRVGVTWLITLTEKPLDGEHLGRYGIRSRWHPIVDMQAPGINEGTAICATIDRLLADQQVVAVHCRAGLGRTGTVLAAYLIWQGASALEALERVRRVEPRWVQSQPQIDFLEQFARAVASRPRPGTAAPDGQIRPASSLAAGFD